MRESTHGVAWLRARFEGGPGGLQCPLALASTVLDTRQRTMLSRRAIYWLLIVIAVLIAITTAAAMWCIIHQTGT
jgi:hypothetical protein